MTPNLRLTAFGIMTLACLTCQAADPSEKHWELLIGQGKSHPGWGDTRERVETRDIMLRQVRPQAFSRGEDWYRNRRSLTIELPLHLLTSPQEPPMFGIYFNSSWRFQAHPLYQPYLFVGGGPLYTHADIPGTSSKLKGSYQAGAGLKINLDIASLNLEYRYHHVSNGGIDEPNDPLNSGKFMVGFGLPF